MAPEDAVVEDLILRLEYAEGPESEELAEEIEAGGAQLAERIAAALPALRGERARNACRALGLIGPAAEAALPALQSVAERRSVLVLKAHEARAAEQAMLRICIGDPEVFRGGLSSTTQWRLLEALDALGRWPDAVAAEKRAEVRDLLIAVIESGEPEVMPAALQALPPFAGGAAPAEEAVARRLTWPDPGVKLAAVNALRRLRPQSPSLTPLLVGALQQETETDAITERVTHGVRTRVRSAALWALARLGRDAGDAASEVSPFLSASDATLREHASRTLGYIAGPGHSVVDALVERLTADEAAHVRAAAAGALGRMGADDAEAISALTAALVNVHTRKSAAWALKQSGEAALPAAPALIGALDGNRRRRMVVVGALVGGGPEVVHALREGLHRDGRWQRIGCAEATAALGPSAASLEPTLRELLYDRRQDVQKAAQEALEAIEVPDSGAD